MDMMFLYFPENKMEYIPAFIALVIFMIAAVATMYMIYKKSQKDARKTDEKFKDAEMYVYNPEVKNNKEEK